MLLFIFPVDAIGTLILIPNPHIDNVFIFELCQIVPCYWLLLSHTNRSFLVSEQIQMIMLNKLNIYTLVILHRHTDRVASVTICLS